MNGTILTRSARVLDLVGHISHVDTGDAHVFASADRRTTIPLNAEAWADMGEPTQITVTIQPGDHLTES